MTRRFFLLVVVLVGISGVLPGAVFGDPKAFDPDSEIKINSSKPVQASNGEDKIAFSMDDFEKTVDKGLGKAKDALEKLDKQIDKILQDLKGKKGSGSGSSSGSSSSSGTSGTSASTPSGTSSASSGSGLGEAFKEFFKSLGNMFKNLWNYVKAVWTEITGPDKNEDVITNTINDVNTSLKKSSLDSSVKRVGNATVDLGKSIGGFFKNLFD